MVPRLYFFIRSKLDSCCVWAPLLKRIRNHIQFRVFVQRLAAVIASKPDENIPALAIRNYIAALLGGQEMETELMLGYI